MYEYKMTLIRILDGDTVRAEVDLGLDVTIKLTLRLEGIDAPEMPSSEGQRSKEYLADLLVPPLILRTIKDRREKYGRYRAIIYSGDNEYSANELMVEAEMATPWPA